MYEHNCLLTEIYLHVTFILAHLQAWISYHRVRGNKVCKTFWKQCAAVWTEHLWTEGSSGWIRNYAWHVSVSSVREEERSLLSNTYFDKYAFISRRAHTHTHTQSILPMDK